MKQQSIGALYAFVFSLGLAPTAYASIIQHVGSNDPTTEGWNLSLGSGGGVVLNAIDDAGTAAWVVDDNSTAAGSTATYDFGISTADVVSGASLGWSLTVTMRSVDIPDIPSGSTFASYQDGTTSWQLQFGTDSDGDQIVLARDLLAQDTSGTTFTLQGIGSEYTTYQMIYDPLLGNADIFVNGVEQISNYSGFVFTTAAPAINWGGGRSPDTGQGNYSLVSFDIQAVPAPAAMWLFGSGLLGLTGVAKRKKK